MSSPIQLITGLANPGKEYAETRHNAGAWFLERLADMASVTLRSDSKLHGLHSAATLEGQKCQLLIPTTYMNRSGISVAACMKYYKLTPETTLIAHDEIDLPVGDIRLKIDGGDGGHNGLKDIISHLHTKKFYRLRIGVGRPKHSKDVVDYVLERPSKADRIIIDDAITRALAVVPQLLNGDIQQAMQLLHTVS